MSTPSLTGSAAPIAARTGRAMNYDAGADLSDIDDDLETQGQYDQDDYYEDGDQYDDAGQDIADNYSDAGDNFAATGDGFAQGGPAGAAPTAVVTVESVDSSPTMLQMQHDTNLLLSTLIKTLAEQQTSAHAAAMRASKFSQHLVTREINLQLTASLRDLYENPSKAVLKLDQAGSPVFPLNKKPLVSVVIKQWRNPFPCSFMLTANNLPNKAASPVISQSKVVGLFQFDGKGVQTSINEPILTDDESAWSREFRSNFPETTPENVGKNIQHNTKVDKQTGAKIKQFLVPADDCVASKVIDKRIEEGMEFESLWNDSLEKYVIDAAEATLAMNEIKENLATQVRAVDLNSELAFELQRAVVSSKARASTSVLDKNQWLDRAEIGAHIKSGNIDAEFDKVHHLSVKMNVTWLDGPQASATK